ncbi:MAG: hypothetical protein U9N37_06070 [Thermodesulfobacteriota bacterium]|nr:hypothetical protein [Thermodesulfobacteriota bacterium]
MFEKLVIFDYSGTLSLDAVRFGEDDNLTGELHRSGLAALGIADPETFWKEIVNPAWDEGSTTSIGYREIIYRKIREELSPPVSDDKIRLCASRFVDSYLDHSTVDGRWRPILRKLGGEPSVINIIATDHYAEATDYIVGFLKKMGAGAISLKDVPGATVSQEFVVANSADIGAHKVDPGFWEMGKSILKLDAIQSILIIDDFGFNEEAGDSYADQRKVEDRKRNTIDLLERVFRVPVYAIPFVLTGKDKKTCGALISQASLEIEQWLSTYK